MSGSGHARPEPSYQRERALERALGGPVAGVDEAGRGPLAGPVVVAAVVLPARLRLEGLADSKTLSPAQRERLLKELRAKGAAIGLGWATSREVDRLNVLRATHRAMARAVARLTPRPVHLLVDGLPVEGLPVPHTALVRGDARCACVSAASVVAKVVRDRFMRALDRRYPEYGFARNMGYPTAEHRRALARAGPCRHHRFSFAPVRAALLCAGAPRSGGRR